MRIIFMGTPEFAVASLDMLIKNNYNIVAVITAPDRPSGRGQQISQSAVKKYASEKNLNVLQPQNLKSEEFLNELRDLRADLQLVVAFRMLPDSVWNMPVAGTYNLHASLLPKYRGAAPINWAIINGDTESGVTTFKLKHEIDTGDILLQENVVIKATDTAGDLHDVLMETGAKLLLKSVKIIEGKFSEGKEPHFQKQSDGAVSHAPKIYKDMCRINWNKSALEIYNFIRGMSPYPTAFGQLVNGDAQLKTIKIFFCDHKIMKHQTPVGTVVTDQKSYLHVYCCDGVIEITDLQLEGKKRIKISEFLKGFKIDQEARMIF